MATLCLTCGLPASGKTTVAKQIEARGALRLTADEWLWEILPNGPREEHDALRPAVERLQWQTAMRALELARAARDDAALVVLLSGGASALLAAPVPGVTLSEKVEASRALMRGGAIQ